MTLLTDDVLNQIDRRFRVQADTLGDSRALIEHGREMIRRVRVSDGIIQEQDEFLTVASRREDIYRTAVDEVRRDLEDRPAEVVARLLAASRVASSYSVRDLWAGEEVAAFVFVREDVVGHLSGLVELRRQPREYRGLPVFPAGRLDPGEHPIAAFFREVREELGVRPVEWRSLGTFVCHDFPTKWPCHAFQVTRWEGEIPSKVLDSPDGDLLVWRPLESLRDQRSVDQTRTLARSVLCP